MKAWVMRRAPPHPRGHESLISPELRMNLLISSCLLFAGCPLPSCFMTQQISALRGKDGLGEASPLSHPLPCTAWDGP